MADKECEGPTKCGWVESERILAKTFEAWRAEFREILEEHRKDIQTTLEGKAGTESLWKLAAIIVAIGGVLSGIISMAASYLGR